MLKEQIDKFKNIFKNEDGNNKKKIENIVVFIVILIITIIVINMILKDDNKEKTKQTNSIGKTLAQTGEKVIETSSTEYDLEQRLSEILSKIEGVGNVKVLITYAQSSEKNYMYNEDSTTSDTEEKDSGGGNRKISQTSTKKEVIYEEIDGKKVPITQSTIMPKIEGAVILASGANNSEVKIKITQAVEAATGLATHKIQVFEMKK